MLPDVVVRSRRVVASGATRPASVHIHGGKIVGVLSFDDVPPGCAIDDVGDAAVMPGVVDTHVQVGEAGGRGGEAFASLTRAAAAGGVTTLVVMPSNRVPATIATTAEGVAARRRAADGNCHVDVGFWGGVVPGNARELAPMLDAGVFGFTCSLLDGGASGLPAVAESDLRVAMPAIARLGLPLLVHAELPGPVEAAPARARGIGFLSSLLARRSHRQYRPYLDSRPKSAENDAIALLIGLCKDFGTRVHIAPLSSSDGLKLLYHARSARLPITAETCPHYLMFVADEIADGATAFTCAPPIRERENREFLWAALAGGLMQMVVSDHVPAPAMKPPRGDFSRAQPGIASLQLSLAATWTGAVARHYTLSQLADWMCRLPARLAGLGRKGAIEVGYDADLVVFDPDAELRVDAAMLPRGDETPYVGLRLRGAVERTYLRGRRIYERRKPIDRPLGYVMIRTG